MRLLLDECVPRRLKRDLVGHDVEHVLDALKTVKAGERIRVAAESQ